MTCVENKFGAAISMFSGDDIDIGRGWETYESPPHTPITFGADESRELKSPAKSKSSSSSKPKSSSSSLRESPPRKPRQFRDPSIKPKYINEKEELANITAAIKSNDIDELKRSAVQFAPLYKRFTPKKDSQICRNFVSRYKYLQAKIKRLEDPAAAKDKALKVRIKKIMSEYRDALEFIQSAQAKIALARKIPRASNYITVVAKLREEMDKKKARVVELEKIIKTFPPEMI